MLTALRIGNFKAFGDSQRIPIRPLTLIFGANSAGKSSIIHALLLARHAVEKGDLDVHRTTAGGESVDLGGFRQYVYRRDLAKRMEWTAEIDLSTLKGRAAELLSAVRRASVSVAIGITLDDKGRPAPGAAPEVLSYEILSDGAPLIRMSRRRDGILQLDRLEHTHPVFRNLVKAVVETATTAGSLQASDYEGLDQAINGLVPEIVARIDCFLPAGLLRTDLTTPTGGQATLFPVSRGRRQEDLAAAVRFFLPRALDDLIRAVALAISAELERLRYLGPPRSYPPRHLAFSQHHDPNWFAGGGYAWDVVRRDEGVRAAVNEWLLDPKKLKTPYELIVRELVGIDQLDGPLLQGVEHMNEHGLDLEVDVDGTPYPVIKDPEAEANRLKEMIRSSDVEKLPELVIVDRRSNTIVSHRDVGIGVSQVLPVLVSAYAAKGEIIAIEQPEIHLHPALQAELGDVFIESALGKGRNTFLIETHSEHLILRIMRRMRDTSRNALNGRPPVTPDDVCVLYVRPEGAASVIQELRLDSEGVLLDPWPGGFFEEGYRERFAEEPTS
jgi:hypothetical protein